MSKIIMIAENIKNEAELAIYLSKILNKPIAQVRQNLLNKIPFFEEELFLNNHDEIAKIIRNIVHFCNLKGEKIKIIEASSDESFQSLSTLKNHEIDQNILENIFKSWDQLKQADH